MAQVNIIGGVGLGLINHFAVPNHGSLPVQRWAKDQDQDRGVQSQSSEVVAVVDQEPA